MACLFNGALAFKEAKSSLLKILKEKSSLGYSDVRSIFNLIFKDTSNDMIIPDSNDPEVVGYINKVRNIVFMLYKNRTKIDISQLPDFDYANIRQIFFLAWQGDEVDSSPKATSNEILVSSTESNSRALASDKFIRDAYGTATEVLLKAVLEMKKYLFDSCFLNRGLTEGMHITKVTSTETLNENIRAFQLKLFNDICVYLERINELPEELKQNNQLYKNLNRIVTSTKAWENNFNHISKFLSSEVFNTQLLIDYLKAKPNSTEALALKAYNAFVFLRNFDSFMDSIFRDGINILRFGIKDGSDKYSFKSKTSNQNTFHRKDDNVMVEDEADAVTKLLIETTLLWDGNSDVEGKYLTYQDYAYVSSIMKIWITDPSSANLKFDPLRVLSLNLSQRTKNFISGKTFSLVLAALRLNYLQIIPIVAELYLNEDTLVLQQPIIANLTNDLKLKVTTIMHRLFNPNNHNSINNLTDFLNPLQIFRNLCLTSDSIFRNILTLCYKDEDGFFYERLMSDLTLYKLSLNITNTVNNINDRKVLPDNFLESFKSKYGFIKERNIAAENKTVLEFKIPLNAGVYLGIRVNKSTEEVDARVVDAKETTMIKDIYTGHPYFNLLLNKIKELSDLVLGTNFVRNNIYFLNFITNKGSVNGPLMLMDFIGAVLNRIYISNVDLKYLSSSEAINHLKSIFGSRYDEIGYNTKSKSVNLSGKGANKAVILALANAYSEYLNLNTAASINNSENKAQSMLAFSKLMDAYGILWNLLEIRNDSATRDLDILKPGVLKDVSTINEYWSKNERKSKKAVEMSPAEFGIMSIMTDFIPGLYETDVNSRITNGLIEFVASVNSDKSTVDKLAIDTTLLTSLTDVNNNPISYLKASTENIYLLINKNLGGYYSHMVDSIINDFNKLGVFLSELYGFANFNIEGLDCLNNFQRFKGAVAEYNLSNGTNYTERYLILKAVLEYNKLHPKEPITLIENIHIGYDKNGIIKPFSNTILALLFRFGYKGSNSYVSNILTTKDTTRWSTIELFMGMKELLLVGSLLENNTKFPITILSPTILEKLFNDYKNWIDSSGNLIIAVIDGIPISTKLLYISTFNSASIKQGLMNRYGRNSVTINPLIRKYNAMHYLFTLQWMFTTVGSFVAHPVKVERTEKINSLLNSLNTTAPWLYEMMEETSLFNAQCKRNVSFTALMQLFLLNDLRGVNSDYKVAVVEDLHKYVDVLTSQHNKVTPLDGATICDPFTVYHENVSLASNSSGLTKKTFVHAKHPKTGNGVIIKTAVFGMNNDLLRLSPDTLLNVFYKMSNGIWKDQNGNILTNYNILSSDLESGKSLFPKDGLYYRKNGKYYWISRIEHVEGTNDYIRYEYEVDINGEIKLDTLLFTEDGRPKPTAVPIDNVNNNFAAWKLFGGLYSMELTNTGLKLSENSVKMVVECMNHKGFKLSDDVKTQADFYQPMKHSQTNYLVTAGAIKHGLANVNPNTVFDDNESELSTFILEMILAGTLLDKEHHADFSEVSLPTLVISACAALGYSFYDADSLYNGISSIAQIALEEIMNEAKIYLNDKDKTKFLDLCANIVIKNLATASTLNFGTYLAESILKAAQVAKKQEYEWSKLKLPFSDNTIFYRAVNALSNYITNNAIKLKMPGTLSIMTPSHKMIPIYGDRKFSDYSNPFIDIRKVQIDKYDSKPIFDRSNLKGHIADINIDYTYKILRKLKIETLQLDNNIINVTYNGVSYNILVDPNLLSVLLYDGVLSFVSEIPSFNDIERFAIYQAIREKTKKRRKKIATETLDEYNLRINQEAYDEYIEVSQTNFEEQIYHLTVITTPVNPENTTQINYYDLRNDESVTKVTEYIMSGRDLGSYNLRFNATIEQSQSVEELPISDTFNIWDLKSVQDAWANPNDKEAKNQMRIDLLYLSKSLPNLVNTFLNFIELLNSIKDDPQALITFRTNLINWIKLKLKILPKILSANYETLLKFLQDLIEKTNNVTIKTGDKIYTVKVDRNSIRHLDYEIIMPKVFKTVFGLDDDVCLAEIKNNPDYFIIQSIRKQESKLDSKDYHIEIKSDIGNHTYLALDSDIDLEGFYDITSSVNQELDDNGTAWRVDEDGERMYELKPGLRIYSDGKTEVFVLNNSTNETGVTIKRAELLLYYLNQFEGSKVLFSETALKASDTVLEELLSALKESKWEHKFMDDYIDENVKSIKEYMDSYNKNVPIITEKDVNAASRYLKYINEGSTLTDQQKLLLDKVLRSPDYRYGREKFNSFMESLKVIAARIPAQNMQSFMAMDVIGFSNGDRNTAYVSDLLIFLLGSKK